MTSGPDIQICPPPLVAPPEIWAIIVRACLPADRARMRGVTDWLRAMVDSWRPSAWADADPALIFRGSVASVEWGYRRLGVGLMPRDEVFQLAVSATPAVLDWVIRRARYLREIHYIRLAFAHGRLKTLEWLAGFWQIRPAEVVAARCLKYAVGYNRPEVVQWAAVTYALRGDDARGSDNPVHRAIVAGNRPMAECLVGLFGKRYAYEPGLCPQVVAAETGSLPILAWTIETFGLALRLGTPSPRSLELAAAVRRQDMDMVMWMIRSFGFDDRFIPPADLAAAAPEIRELLVRAREF